MEPLFTWAHIAGLHFGCGDARSGWDQELVRQRLKEDLITAERRGVPPLNALVVTGGLTDHARPEEFREAEAWLKVVAGSLRLSSGDIYLVPGGRDMQPAGEKASRALQRLLRELHKGDDHLDNALADRGDSAALLARRKAYEACEGCFAETRGDHALSWFAVRERSGLRVRLTGLDTALLYTSESDQGRLQTGRGQIVQAFEGCGRSELVLALCGHPLDRSWLFDSEQVLTEVRKRAQVILYGHGERGASRVQHSGSGPFLTVTAGAAYQEGGLAGHSYNCASIVVDERDRFFLRHHPRLWSLKHREFRGDPAQTPDQAFHQDYELSYQVEAPPRPATSGAQVPAVFFAYTPTDLSEHAVALMRLTGARPAIDWRSWPGRGSYLAWARARIKACAVLVVLVAHRYGAVPSEDDGGDGDRSLVWLLVEAARSAGKPVLAYLVDPKVRWSPDQMEGHQNPVAGEGLDRFKAALRHHVAGFFSTGGDLIPGFPADLRSALEGAGARPVDSGAIRSYLRRLDEDNRYLKLIGFGEELQVRLPMKQVYVPLEVTLSRGFSAPALAGRFDDDELGRGHHCERDLAAENALRKARDFQLRGVVVLGDPGSGKTTLLRSLARQAADLTEGPATLGLPSDVVPVLLRLRNLQPDQLSEGLLGFLERELDAVRHSDFKGFAQKVQQRRLLWLLDGLDEVPSLEHRAQVSAWIRGALVDRPDDLFVVTSRYAGYQKEARLGDAFLELHVQPLKTGQIRDFVERWYRAVERHIRGASRIADADSEASARTESLLDILGGRDYRTARLASMVANPLLLAVLCIVHKKGADLPRRRVDLYSRCLDVFLEHWRRALEARVGRAVLAPIAWWLHQEDERAEAAIEDWEREARGPLERLAGLPNDPAGFLRRVLERCGLIVMPDPGRYAFLHLSFQEYLAALHATREVPPGQLLARMESSWWREVILLALALGSESFTRGFFEAARDRGYLESRSTWIAEFLDDTLEVPVEVFAEVLRDPTAPPERVLATLQLFRARDPGESFQDACRAIARGPDRQAEARELAREILARAGEESVEVSAPAPGSVRVHQGITLVYIPGGTFLMGGDDDQAEEREKPVHEVTLSPFWLGKYPVTNAEYAGFLDANPGHQPPVLWTDGRFNRPDQPVVGVSWHDAEAFCSWAGLSLPSEAQWEFACRGEPGAPRTRFWSGDSEADLAKVAWYDANSGNEPQPVGQKPANAWGLHDMHGNVWEWCLDWRDNEFYKRSPDVDPVNLVEGTYRVLRGGCWYRPAWCCGSAYRYGFRPSFRLGDLGFRVVLVPGQREQEQE